MRNERQTRGMPAEFRAVDENGRKEIEGYFAVFGSSYELFPGASESIDPHAFDGELTGDVRALVNHDSSLVLGRTKAGTLELRVDATGLWGRIAINPEDTDAMNLYARVKRGDVSQCSFGFDILEERTDVDPETGHVHWTILRVKLYEVSCCTFPAYQETSITARAQAYKTIQDRQAEAWKEKMKARKNAWH